MSHLLLRPLPAPLRLSFARPVSGVRSPPPPPIRTVPVRCMAHPRRVKMVAKQIMRELSDMLLTDPVLQHTILPEAALGADRYLSSLTTVSDVEISSDLQDNGISNGARVTFKEDGCKAVKRGFQTPTIRSNPTAHIKREQLIAISDRPYKMKIGT